MRTMRRRASEVLTGALPADSHVHSQWSWDALAGSMEGGRHPSRPSLRVDRLPAATAKAQLPGKSGPSAVPATLTQEAQSRD
jgi:hypothetical protein